MKALDRKLLRNILHMKGQFTAICLVIACGVATFVMSLATMQSLQSTMLSYYRQYRFADVFAGMKRAPGSLGPRIAEIPGVARAYPRIVQDVTLDVEGFPEPAIGRIISVPDFDQPPLCALHLRKGRWIEPGHAGEVIVSEAFADAHRLQPGDSVRAVLNGRKKELTLVGMAITPEYIYQLREGDILPDDKRFGLFWMAETDLGAAFDMEGAFNNVVLSVSRSASIPEVLQHVDDLIEDYGGLGAYDRSDHTSHQYITNEIQQLESMGIVIPTIFLSVAAFLLNVVLHRLIATQREEIAALKALGYSGWELGLHYTKLVVAIVTVGTVIGTGLGAWMGHGLTQLYLDLYRFPVLEFQFDWRVILGSLAVSLLAGAVGTFAAVRQAIKLPAAEAMRPQAPADFRPTVLERVGLHWLLSQPARIVLRNIERRPLKAFMSCLGIAMGLAVLIVGNYTKDSIDYALEGQFHVSQRQDVTVAFVEPRSVQALYEVAHLPGVQTCEPFRTVPVRLRAEHRNRRVAIMGLATDSQLFRPLDMGSNSVDVPEEGLLVSRVLADVLGVRPGDEVSAEVLIGLRRKHTIRITGVIDDFAGLNAFMNLGQLRKLMEEGETASGAYLLVDDDAVADLYSELKNTPLVAGVTIKQAAIDSFNETIAENLLRFQTFNILFATVIAVGVVYNSARITLSERSRELATLRVIGFSRREISVILLGELSVLVLVAIPLGMGIGTLLAWWSSQTMVETELFRIPLIIDSSTYGLAVVVIVAAAFVSGIVVRWRLDELDLIGVLKTRD